jgi:hypothetical protein
VPGLLLVELTMFYYFMAMPWIVVRPGIQPSAIRIFLMDHGPCSGIIFPCGVANLIHVHVIDIDHV